MTIWPIVEGHGEVDALPILLRRLAAEAHVYVEVGPPIRKRRGQLVTSAAIEQAVGIAVRQTDCAAVLILFDGDDDCPAELGPAVQGWATDAARDIPTEVVIAHREYEAWFLAALDSLRGIRGIREDAEPHPAPEQPRGAKELVQQHMADRRSYSEVSDQPALTAGMSLPDAYRRSRSFRKLTKSFGSLLEAMGHDIGVWPPPSWTSGGGLARGAQHRPRSPAPALRLSAEARAGAR